MRSGVAGRRLDGRAARFDRIFRRSEAPAPRLSSVGRLAVAWRVRNMALLDAGRRARRRSDRGSSCSLPNPGGPFSGTAIPLADGEHVPNPRPHDRDPRVAPLVRTVRRMVGTPLALHPRPAIPKRAGLSYSPCGPQAAAWNGIPSPTQDDGTAGHDTGTATAGHPKAHTKCRAAASRTALAAGNPADPYAMHGSATGNARFSMDPEATASSAVLGLR